MKVEVQCWLKTDVRRYRKGEVVENPGKDILDEVRLKTGTVKVLPELYVPEPEPLPVVEEENTEEKSKKESPKLVETDPETSKKEDKKGK